MKKKLVAGGLAAAMLLNAGTVMAAPDAAAAGQLDYTAHLHYELEPAGTIEDPDGDLSFMYDALLDSSASDPTMLSSSGEVLASGLDDLEYLGGGIYSARTPLDEDNVNKTGLYTSDGEELIPGDAASIVMPYNREQDGSARFIGAIFTTEETDSEDDCIIYFTSDMVSLSVGEDDVMYKGYFKVYDLENRQFVPGVELEAVDRYGFYDFGDSFIVDGGGTAKLYDADGNELVDVGSGLGDAGYDSFVLRDDNGYKIMDSQGNEVFASDDYQGIYIACEPLNYYEIYDGEDDAPYHLIDMGGNRIFEDPLPIIYEMSATTIVTEDADGNEVVVDYSGAVVDDEPYGRDFPLGAYGMISHEGSDDVTVITPDAVYTDLTGYDESRLIFTKDDKIVSLAAGEVLGEGYTTEDIGSVLSPGLVSIVDPSTDRYSDPKISVYDILTGEELLPNEYQDVQTAGDHLYAQPIGTDTWQVYKIHLASGEAAAVKETEASDEAEEADAAENTDAADETAAAADDEAEEELAAEDERFAVGEESGQTYEQEFFGFELALPEGWAFADEEQMNQLDSNIADVIVDEGAKEAINNGTSYIDMYAENSSTFSNVNASITKISMQEALMARLDMNALLENLLPELQKQMESMGFVDVEAQISETQFLGETVPCIDMVSYMETESGNIPMYQRQVYVQEGTYILTLTATSYVDDTRQEILDACSAL